MSKVFDHPVQGQDAARRLLSLRQGSRSVAEYSIEFRTLVAESGWNEAASQAVFVQGLTEQLKDELVSHPEPGTLDDLIALSIRIGNRCSERRRERRAGAAGSDVTSRRGPRSPVFEVPHQRGGLWVFPRNPESGFTRARTHAAGT